jgi:hypothetical protein
VKTVLNARIAERLVDSKVRLRHFKTLQLDGTTSNIAVVDEK